MLNNFFFERTSNFWLGLRFSFFLTPALNWKLVYVYARSHSYILVISIAVSTQPLVFNFVSSCIPKVVARRYSFHPLSG